MRFPRRGVFVGAPPPPRRVPIVGGERPPPRARVSREVAESFEPGRAFAIFGPRGAGISTLLRVLHEESETPTALLTLSPQLEDEVEAERARGAEVLLIDGAPTSAEDVQRIYDARIIAPGWGGGVIRVDRNAVVDRDFPARLLPIEQRIRDLSLSYFLVHNDDIEQAAINLASRIGLWR